MRTYAALYERANEQLKAVSLKDDLTADGDRAFERALKRTYRLREKALAEELPVEIAPDAWVTMHQWSERQ